jgi:hypothetical protein
MDAVDTRVLVAFPKRVVTLQSSCFLLKFFSN